MPRFRDLRAQQVIRAFERAGGIVKPGKGDHVNIKMSNGMVVTFKAVDEIKIGLLKKMIKKAGLSEEAFERFLR